MKWLFENLSTIIIFAVLAAVIVLIIKSMRKDKKSGKSSCGCNCASCALSKSCHERKH